MASNPRVPAKAQRVALILVILAVPFLITLAWQGLFGDAVYESLLAVRGLNLVGPFTLVSSPFPQNPLYLLILAALGPLALAAAPLMSALGWSATAVMVYLTLQALEQRKAGITAALLIVFSPLVTGTVGAEASWVLALGWAALALSAGWGEYEDGQDGRQPQAAARPRHDRRRAWIKSAVLLLMLGLHFDAGTLVFALALLVIDIRRRRSGWLPLLLVAAVGLAGGLLVLRHVSPPTFPSSLAEFWAGLGKAPLFFRGHDLYWLYLPFITAGLYAAWTGGLESELLREVKVRARRKKGRQVLGSALLWTIVAFITGSELFAAVAAVSGFALSGLGVVWLSARIIASGSLALPNDQAKVYLPGLLTAPLLLIGLLALGQDYTDRSAAPFALQEQAATWLAANSDPAATLFAPPRIGYLAGRQTLPARAADLGQTGMTDIYAALFAQPPDYVVSDQALSWEYITRTNWFKDRYTPLAEFDNAYAADGPVTVWGYELSPYDSGEEVFTSAVIDEHLALVGYKFDPQIITPGEDIYLTLYLQALAPVKTGFHTGVHLAAQDGWIWAWKEVQTPQSIPGGAWEPGLIIPERIRLPVAADLPQGAYDLQVFWRPAKNQGELPITQGDDGGIVDHLQLGYVVVPPVVDSSQATAVGARFADEITLKAARLDPEPPLQPGEALEVVLFWDALKRPAANYTVFVHLLNSAGELVTGSDSMPMNNQFPTQAFRPGILVEDRHTLALPLDLPPGEYQVNVGLYLLDTGERLPVKDAGGVEQADRVLKLDSLQVTD